MLYRGGTLATQGGTLRGALDACLSSPSGRGVIVDESGRLVGSTTAREVLDLIEAQAARSGHVIALIPLDSSSSSPWHFFGYFLDHRSEVLGCLWDHTWLSVVPVVVGLLLALPLGWLARRYEWVYPPMMSITGLLYTIPSIALFVLIPPLLGLDPLSPLQVPIALTPLLAGAAGAGGRRRARRRTAGDAAGGHRARLQAAGSVLPGRAADRRTGDRGRPAGRDRRQRQHRDRRRHHRLRQPRPALRRGLQAVHGHAVLPADRARHHPVRPARARRSTGWCCSSADC